MAGKTFLRKIAGKLRQIAGIQVSTGSANAGDLVALNDRGFVDQSLLRGDLFFQKIREVILFGDVFEGTAIDGFIPTANSAGGQSTSTGVVTNAIIGDRFGVTMALSGSAANSGYSWAANGSSKFLLSGNEAFRAAVYIPNSTLADSSFRLGFNASFNNTDSSGELTIKVIAGVVSGRSNDGAISALTGDITTLSGDTWYVLEILLNSDATEAAINVWNYNHSSLIASATITTNISKTQRRNISVSATSTTSGAKNIVAIDYLYAYLPFPTR